VAKPDFQFEFLSQTLSYLCDKGAELGQKQHLSEEVYQDFCKHPGLSLHDVIGFVATRESFYNKATMNSTRQILFRVQLLSQLTINYKAFRDQFHSAADGEAKNKSYPIYEVSEMLKHCLQHSDQYVRLKS
jgi:hypothetical protein